jgi:hypothetical protein
MINGIAIRLLPYHLVEVFAVDVDFVFLAGGFSAAIKASVSILPGSLSGMRCGVSFANAAGGAKSLPNSLPMARRSRKAWHPNRRAVLLEYLVETCAP